VDQFQAMEDEIARASLSLLPTTPNATWIARVAGAPNELGEPALTEVTTPVRVFLLAMESNGSRGRDIGIDRVATRTFLVAGVPSPRQGDLLALGSDRFRVSTIEEQPMASPPYFRCSAARVLQ
jgi:hypothetical protein